MPPPHAALRAWERHGVSARNADLDGVVMDIIATLAGDRLAALLLRRMEAGREMWMVKLCGVDVRVIYLPSAARVLTVLP